MAKLAIVPTLAMQQRSDSPDFYIRDRDERPATTTPHRHDYFQIQINRGGDTVHHIGGAIRPFPRHTVAFILPHRLHLIPHPVDADFVVINFTQEFFVQHIRCDPLDLEDIPLAEAPELAPFRFQEHLDFTLDSSDFAELETLVAKMRAIGATRQVGSALILKGHLLALIGRICNLYQNQLLALAADKAEKRGRRDALERVTKYMREQIGNPALSLKDAAAAAFLTPNYLTHLLRKETGSTFTDLVLDRRMRLARTHLINTSSSISQIAEHCGFSDEAYFSRRFKKAYDQSPSSFRRQHQGG